jgi:hypothetical protein
MEKEEETKRDSEKFDFIYGNNLNEKEARK